MIFKGKAERFNDGSVSIIGDVLGLHDELGNILKEGKEYTVIVVEKKPGEMVLPHTIRFGKRAEGPMKRE